MQTKLSFVHLALLAWSLVTVCGFRWLLKYEITPGNAGSVAQTWPTNSSITPDSTLPNLILLVHPHCPCSKATIAELAELMSRCPRLVSVHILFVKPSQFPAGWEQTETWHEAARLPGCNLIVDNDGIEAHLFGGRTSGHVLLYDTEKHLAFSGGITVARGHYGENVGLNTVIEFLNGLKSKRSQHCVFGCPLFSNRQLVRDITP